MQTNIQQNFLSIETARGKLASVRSSIELAQAGQLFIPEWPGRDLVVMEGRKHPAKKGLSFQEGRARMLHDLANIELQATELFLRELSEYPTAPDGFRERLSELVLEESVHFEICIDRIEELGFKWGDFPVHLGLWSSVRSSDSLLDRILIVHRYLEASGLDAGAKLVRRLEGIDDRKTERVVRKINNEEADHVLFGSVWYKNICQALGLNFEEDFAERFRRLEPQLPLRMDPVHLESRKKAGFSELELQTVIQHREKLLAKNSCV